MHYLVSLAWLFDLRYWRLLPLVCRGCSEESPHLVTGQRWMGFSLLGQFGHIFERWSQKMCIPGIGSHPMISRGAFPSVWRQCMWQNCTVRGFFRVQSWKGVVLQTYEAVIIGRWYFGDKRPHFSSVTYRNHMTKCNGVFGEAGRAAQHFLSITQKRFDCF